MQKNKKEIHNKRCDKHAREVSEEMTDYSKGAVNSREDFSSEPKHQQMQKRTEEVRRGQNGEHNNTLFNNHC